MSTIPTNKKRKAASQEVLTCGVCFDDVEVRRNKIIACPHCNFASCVDCYTQYVSQDEISLVTCPNLASKCGKEWSREFVIKHFSREFVTKHYVRIKEKQIFDAEQAFLPTTQLVINCENEIKSLIAEDETRQFHYQRQNRRQIDELRDRRTRYRAGILNDPLDVAMLESRQMGNQTEAKKSPILFTSACRAENCRGFLNDQWYCTLCSNTTCSDCGVVRKSDSVTDSESNGHQCNPNDVESFKLIQKDSKPCPKCRALIFKIEGCNHMFCTVCHHSFDWKTGSQLKRNTNPHYYQYMRDAGLNIPREPGDIPDGRVLPGVRSDDASMWRYIRNSQENPFICNHAGAENAGIEANGDLFSNPRNNVLDPSILDRDQLRMTPLFTNVKFKWVLLKTYIITTFEADKKCPHFGFVEALLEFIPNVMGSAMCMTPIEIFTRNQLFRLDGVAQVNAGEESRTRMDFVRNLNNRMAYMRGEISADQFKKSVQKKAKKEEFETEHARIWNLFVDMILGVIGIFYGNMSRFIRELEDRGLCRAYTTKYSTYRQNARVIRESMRPITITRDCKREYFYEGSHKYIADGYEFGIFDRQTRKYSLYHDEAEYYTTPRIHDNYKNRIIDLTLDSDSDSDSGVNDDNEENRTKMPLSEMEKMYDEQVFILEGISRITTELYESSKEVINITNTSIDELSRNYGMKCEKIEILEKHVLWRDLVWNESVFNKFELDIVPSKRIHKKDFIDHNYAGIHKILGVHHGRVTRNLARLSLIYSLHELQHLYSREDTIYFPSIKIGDIYTKFDF